MKARRLLFTVAAAFFAAIAVSPNSFAEETVPVTVENFIRAESDLYFGAVALKEGGFGKFEHHRDVASIDAQTIIRINRGTLYSAVVVDLDAGPATVTLPDPGKRFMSMQIVDEDQYSKTFYAPVEMTFTRSKWERVT